MFSSFLRSVSTRKNPSSASFRTLKTASDSGGGVADFQSLLGNPSNTKGEMGVRRADTPLCDSRFYPSGAFLLFFLSFAFRVLAFAAAFDASIAISLRLLAPSFLARASPPSLASSERTRWINASSIPSMPKIGSGC